MLGMPPTKTGMISPTLLTTALKKVKEAIPPESTLAFVHLASDLEDDTLNPDMRFKETYLSQELDRAQDERTQVITIHKGLIYLDSTGHPTREGTASILQGLAEFFPELILNESFVTTERLYLGVQPLFRYGCVTCHKEGHFVNKLSCCEACLRKMESHDASEKLERIKQLLAEPLPGEINETVNFPIVMDDDGSSTEGYSSEGEGSITSQETLSKRTINQVDMTEDSYQTKRQNIDGGEERDY